MVFSVSSLNLQVYVKNFLTCIFWKQGGKGRERVGEELQINLKMTSTLVVILIPASMANVSTFEKHSVETFFFFFFVISNEK